MRLVATAWADHLKGMIWTRDHLTLAALLVLIAGIAGLSIRSHHIGTPAATGYASGEVLAFEVIVTKGGGTRGIYQVQLEQGAVVRVMAGAASAEVVPGSRVCVRALQQGDGTDGWIVPSDRCSGV